MDAGKVPSPGSETGFFQALIGDGRPLLALTGVSLALSGAFALFLSATGSFLPHDTAYLGFEPKSLCSIGQCRIVHFMFHDRVAFGGGAHHDRYALLVASAVSVTTKRGMGMVGFPRLRGDWVC